MSTYAQALSSNDWWVAAAALPVAICSGRSSRRRFLNRRPRNRVIRRHRPIHSSPIPPSLSRGNTLRDKFSPDNTRKANTRSKINIRKGNTRKANIRKGNTHKANILKANTRKANTRKGNTRKANTLKANTRKANILKVDRVRDRRLLRHLRPPSVVVGRCASMLSIC